jgi:hypothetical protein
VHGLLSASNAGTLRVCLLEPFALTYRKGAYSAPNIFELFRSTCEAQAVHFEPNGTLSFIWETHGPIDQTSCLIIENDLS